jgi:predicted extracellular nuclease
MTHALTRTSRTAAAAALLPALALLAACGGAPTPRDDAPPVAAPGHFACGEPAHAFATLPRGSRRSDPLEVDLEGVVVASFRRGLGGFVLQSAPADADADPATPEGAFVEYPADHAATRVGQRVRVRGSWSLAPVPADGQWALRAVDQVLDCGEAAVPEPLRIDAAPPDWGRYSGMRVHLPGPLVVTGNDGLLRFGELRVAFGPRLAAATEQVLPGPDAAALERDNARRSLVVDDGQRGEYPRRLWALPQPPAPDAPLRAGSSVAGLTGVFEHRHGSWRLQLTEPVGAVVQAPRPPLPPRDPSQLRVASFNVLNFFNGDGAGGGFPTDRGAASAEAAQRQRAKLVAALAALDADVVGLMEIENDGNGPGSAIAELIAALDAATAPGRWAAVPAPTPRLGSDSISVGLVFRPDRVRPEGPAGVLEQAPFDRHSRVPLAQVFQPLAGGPPMRVVVNHFKSKGGCDDADAGNADAGDGQACFAAIRGASARALADWLATLEGGSGVGPAQTLILGDLNAHSREDAVRLLRERGYADLLASAQPGHTFVFRGQAGRLDHALAGPALAARVRAAGVWAINADELPEFGYDGRPSNGRDLYAPDPWRSSDHDPVWVDLATGAAP